MSLGKEGQRDEGKEEEGTRVAREKTYENKSELGGKDIY